MWTGMRPKIQKLHAKNELKKAWMHACVQGKKELWKEKTCEKLVNQVMQVSEWVRREKKHTPWEAKIGKKCTKKWPKWVQNGVVIECCKNELWKNWKKMYKKVTEMSPKWCGDRVLQKWTLKKLEKNVQKSDRNESKIVWW